MWLASGDASLIRPRVGYFTKPKTNEREDRKKNPDNGRGSLNAELENWKNIMVMDNNKLRQGLITNSNMSHRRLPIRSWRLPLLPKAPLRPLIPCMRPPRPRRRRPSPPRAWCISTTNQVLLLRWSLPRQERLPSQGRSEPGPRGSKWSTIVPRRDAQRPTQSRATWRPTRGHTLARSPMFAAGKVVAGSLRGLMSWHDTIANTPAIGHSNAGCVSEPSRGQTIFPSTWRGTWPCKTTQKKKH